MILKFYLLMLMNHYGFSMWLSLLSLAIKIMFALVWEPLRMLVKVLLLSLFVKEKKMVTSKV